MEAMIAKFLSHDKQTRILVLDNTSIVRELMRRQPLRAVGAEALATSFSLSCLLCATLKDEQRLSIRIQTSTAGRYFQCDVESNGHVRGYASDAVVDSGGNAAGLTELIGSRGLIRMTKDIGMGSLFTSAVDMPYQNIVDDFAHFFRQSEQLDTAFRYFYSGKPSDIRYSRAVLVQALPFAKDGTMEHWLSELDKSEDVFRTIGSDSEQRIRTVFGGADLVERQPLLLSCSCSKEALLPLLYGLGPAELEDIRRNRQTVEIACHLCGRKYEYNPQDLFTQGNDWRSQ
ncbi:Hsp33 family molecular chaperone HslO [Cohnella xylanilytica]|uniref:Hsp33 family molecular chaperone HslO n=2 Tax=Cohnella xylanilytica TaxID=557555 RepID=A0A841U679_9BACL|nr:Hsp33 family molecular chaperone HslO [Cohnella xylanilytica]